MAINNKKIINYDIHTTNINKTIFVEYMKKLDKLVTNSYFLMDNVSFHKSKDVRDIFENSTNQLLFIPPYSPEFNPIELVFSQLKRNLNNFSSKKIINKIRKSIKLVKKEHLENYYKNSF